MTKINLAVTLMAGLVVSGCASGQAARPALAAPEETQQCSPSIREIAAGFKSLFYDQGRVREAYETYVAEDYIQHNPHAQNGRDAAIAFLEPIYRNNPQHRMTVHRMIVEAPYIVVHLHGQSSPADPGAAAIDILRVENCRIVEHWDVTQKVPAQTASGNSMF